VIGTDQLSAEILQQTNTSIVQNRNYRLKQKVLISTGIKNRCPQHISHVSECFIFITMFYNLSTTKMKIRSYTEGFTAAPLVIRQDIKTQHILKKFKCYGFRSNCQPCGLPVHHCLHI